MPNMYSWRLRFTIFNFDLAFDISRGSDFISGILYLDFEMWIYLLPGKVFGYDKGAQK